MLFTSHSSNNTGFDQYGFTSGFYKLPKIENIRRKPTHPYQYSNKGMLHSNKLESIYEVLLSNKRSKEKYKEISDLTHEHAISDYLPDLEEDEIADFLRHTIYLNRESLGWDVADNLLTQLDRNYLPRWKLRRSEIDENFRNTLITMVDWEPSNSNQLLLEKYTTVLRQNSSSQLTIPQPLVNFNSLNNIRWNITKLSTLYETLNMMIWQLNLLDNQQFSPLIKKIEKIFEQLLVRSDISFTKNIALSLIYCNGLLQKDIESVIKAKSIIVKLKEKISSNKSIDDEDYKWILGSFFSQITARLIETEIDILTRKMTVTTLIESFLRPLKQDFNKWQSHFMESQPHPWVFCYEIRGYAEALYILREYTKDHVTSEDRNEILKLHQNLSKFLLSILLDFLSRYNDNTRLDISDMNILEIIQNLKLPPSMTHSFRETLYFSIKYSLLYQTPFVKDNQADLIDLNSVLILDMYSNNYQEIFRLDMILNFDEIELENIFKRIAKEVNSEKSVITSDTFENEIIMKFSNLFEFIVNRSSEKYTRLHKYGLEVLLWYLSYWYWKFQEEDLVPEETNMILAPFISILFHNLSIYYYENNQNTKAHIMLINDYFFKSISDHLNTDDKPIEHLIGKIFEQFGDTYNKLEFSFVPANLKNFTVDTIIKNSTTKNLRVKSTGVEFSEETLFQYMDLRDKLAEFFQTVPIDFKDTIVAYIQKFDIFTLPVNDTPILFDKIGLHIKPETLHKQPFPLIRDIHSYAVAIKLFPLKVNLPSFNIDMEM